MSECESREHCSFFMNEMGNSPSLVRLMRRRYCDSDKEHCARYMIKSMLYKGYTPKDDGAVSALEHEVNRMYPNDLQKAHDIISLLEA